MVASGKRFLFLLTGAAMLGIITLTYLPVLQANAAQITSRSLTLQPGVSAGGSAPSGVVNHLFTFTLPTAGTISSISLQYCTTANVDIGGVCTTPAGLSTTSATLGSPNAGFNSVVNTTNGDPYVTSTAGITITAGEVLSIQLQTVTNQNDLNCGGTVGSPVNNCTFFVRITTYTSTNATTGAVDSGTVAASTSTQIQLTGTMPESLIFCTGGTVNVNSSGIPDCSTATSGNITFNQLFSPAATAYATSKLAASTNALSGYVVTVQGLTLTSGANSIPAIGATPTLSAIGKGQFGMNLAANTGTAGTDPIVTGSAYVAPTANGTNYMGKASANFNIGDPAEAGTAQTSEFTFNSTAANTVAASDDGTGTGKPTDAQIFTTSYIVNVAGHQPAGTYVTTLTYICTATF